MGKRLRAAVECYYCKTEIIHFVKEETGKLRPVFKGIHTLRVVTGPTEPADFKTVLVCDDCFTNPRHRYPGAPPLREETPRISIRKRRMLAERSECENMDDDNEGGE